MNHLPGKLEERAMMALFDHPGVTAAELASLLDYSYHGIGHVVARLRLRKFITRDNWMLYLTPTGHEILDRLREGWVIRWTHQPHFVSEHKTTCPTCKKATVMIYKYGQTDNLWECSRCGARLTRKIP